MLGFLDPDWESEVVADLDSALNKWIDTIPAHRTPPCSAFDLSFTTMQSDGIPTEPTLFISINPRHCICSTIIYKS